MRRLLALAFSLVLVACDRPQEAAEAPPAAVVQRYLNAAARNDWTTAYRHVSSADQTTEALPVFGARAGPASGIAAGKTLVSHQVVDVTHSAERASARVELHLRESTQYSAQPRVTSVQLHTFNLVREHTGWKIALFPTLAAAEKATAESTQHDDGAWGVNAAALPRGEPLAQDGAWSLAGRVLDAEARKIASDGNTQAYADQLQLFELRAGYYRTPLDRRLPGVEFKLRNQGARALAKVAVTVYFKNAQGVVIAEETFYPVLVSGHPFLDTPPLKPNQVWRLEHKKFFVADAVPSEWKAGIVEAKITDIGFAKSAG